MKDTIQAIRDTTNQPKILWHNPPTSTDFALQMIEDVQKVSVFGRGP